MIYEQDGIKYKIQDGKLKGWKGQSPFKKPTWNGTSIVEGWDAEDEAAFLDSQIPKSISKLNFKLGLLKNHGITNSQVEQVFESVESPDLKETLMLLWYESRYFEIDDEYIQSFAPQFGLKQDDLRKIFLEFN